MQHLLCTLLIGCGSVAATKDAGPDGTTTSAQPGDVVWARSMSSAGALGVAAGAGGVLFAGYITAPADLGGGVVTPMGATDLVLGDYMAGDASYIYQNRFNDAMGGSVYGFLERTDSQGNPFLHGVSYGNVDLGLGAVASGLPGDKTISDGFIGRYGPNAPAWVNRLVGPGEDKILATAPAPGSALFAAGWFEQTTAWNGANLTSNGGRDIFVARMNTFTGAVDLTRSYGGTGRDEISGADGDGAHLVLGGFFDDTLALEGGLAINASGPAGNLDLWVAKLDGTSLVPIWAAHFGGPGEDRGTQVAIDTAGDVYLAAQFSGQVGFGAINLSAMGMHDVAIVKLHGDTGAVAWAIQLGSTGDDGVSRIVVDAAGHPVFAGSIADDAVIASLDPNTGSVRWQKRFATSGHDGVQNLAVGAGGELYATINLGGAVDFGVPLVGPAGPASVVARFAP